MFTLILMVWIINGTYVGPIFVCRELRTMAAGGVIEAYEVPQSPSQASTRRDALCKSLYERMFNLIVSRINVSLDPSKSESGVDGKVSKRYLCLGPADVVSLGHAKRGSA